jgi:trimethylamine--corrinoid protein Co-methyltransferase
LTQINAEILSGVVIHQLRENGAPFVYGAACTSTDMRTTIMPHGAPEFPMLGAVFAQLARYYDLPSWSTAGNSDAVIPDQQASIEWTNSLLLAELSGANIVHDVGYLGTGLVGALESLPICNEIMEIVRYVGRGIRIDSDTLATEVIERVGPGGHYLTDKHTLEHFKEEFSSTDLLNRDRYDNWIEEGEVTLREKAKEKVKSILEKHEPEELADDTEKKITEIIAEAEEDYL